MPFTIQDQPAWHLFIFSRDSLTKHSILVLRIVMALHHFGVNDFLEHLYAITIIEVSFKIVNAFVQPVSLRQGGSLPAGDLKQRQFNFVSTRLTPVI